MSGQWRRKPLPSTWNRTRRRILQRDRERCRICGDPGFEVDHIVGAAHGGSDDDGNLWTLCTVHHRMKTQAEATAGTRNKAAQRLRPAEQHPGMKEPQ